jgi:diacylglycerol kinase
VKNRPFRERLGFALAGLATGWQREKSFRSQARLGILAFIGLLVLHPAPVWWGLVAVLVSLVLALELLNSALEGVIDLLHPGLHPEIKAIKDMTAGAVLMISFAALAVGAALAVERVPAVLHEWRLLR